MKMLTTRSLTNLHLRIWLLQSLIPRYYSSLRSDQNMYSQLLNIGVNKNLIESVSSNPIISNHLEDIWNNIPQNKICSDKKIANLIIQLSSKLSQTSEKDKIKLATYIIEKNISSNSDLDKALLFLKSQSIINNQVDWNSFEIALGMQQGINYKNDESFVKKEILLELRKIEGIQKQDLLTNKKYASFILRILRERLKHIESSQIFSHFNSVIESFQKEETKLSIIDNKDQVILEEEIHIWDKIPSLKGRDILYENNSDQVYQKHIEARKGVPYILRFPPEPNGYLHLGHAKALRTNFYSAQKLGGICYLRYDDTNPEKEKMDYIDSIKDNILWFGFTPYKITYSSDYFDKIFDCAIELIKRNLAYVCQQSSEEMSVSRQKKEPSPNRDRDIGTNLQLFQKMKEGQFQESEMCLRLKINYCDQNPTMRDPVIYRIKYHPHPRTGRTWNIYPTYDFTHCLCDSFENITHSLCSLEFEIRRDLYYWILYQLNLYKPIVWEYSRLNVSNSVLSKRKLITLIENKVVEGWDDPRLLTINALRKRGVRPSAINAFVDLVNVSRHGNENIIDQKLLDYCIRKDLESSSPRTMAVIEPIELELVNFMDFFVDEIVIPINPKDKQSGMQTIKISNKVFVERQDIREEEPEQNKQITNNESSDQIKRKLKNDKNQFRGIFPGSEIALKYYGVIRIISVNLGKKQVKAKVISTKDDVRKNSNGQIHWIDCNSSLKCKVRYYNDLFKTSDPNKFDNILDAVSENSLNVFESAFVNQNVLEMINNSINTFQFERLGYFSLDIGIQQNKVSSQQQIQKQLVFHRTVGLKDKIQRDNL